MLIGITGKKRHGKDSVAKIIEKNYGYKLDSFANPLRKFGYDALGITEENREELIEALGITGRQFLQLVGTEIGRMIHKDIWIYCLKLRNLDLNNLVTFDTRYINEAKFIKDNGGKIIRVIRPGVESDDKHTSENGIPDEFVDATVINDSTLENLEQEVEYIVNQFLLEEDMNTALNIDLSYLSRNYHE